MARTEQAVTIEVSTRVAGAISNPTHNACAEELRTAFAHVFGPYVAPFDMWPPWADEEIYRLAGRLSDYALKGHPRRRPSSPCLCATFTAAQGSGFDDGYSGPQHCSACANVGRPPGVGGARVQVLHSAKLSPRREASQFK